ncbi:MAG: bifunctional 5,10-methylenetetrahydrofolate dehydrogenase/5,10-methenyltetrahydrofolate cyclohydrolase [Clostridia bacterium]|nr:bifunctional 5,10-methylenetetrahydrofolate dehydrogenase/5,10-methenyltetrahydrofolate cyclohydrolase [Clostridia bacterium]
MAALIDGKAIAAKVKAEVAEGAEALVREFGEEARPNMTLIEVGHDPVSQKLVGMKAKDCEAAGVIPTVISLSAATSETKLLRLIDRLNRDDDVKAILCQLPLPEHISTKKVLAAIAPEKDVDGFSARIDCDDYDVAACTPAAVMRMLRENGVDVAGRHCVVVGRSNIVGKPMAIQLLLNDATVTVCHSRTEDVAAYTRMADVLIVEVGRAGYITADMIKEGAVVIDVGMNYIDGRPTGDVDFAGASQKASLITPVPGGVGPMTRAYLLVNALKLAERRVGKETDAERKADHE